MIDAPAPETLALLDRIRVGVIGLENGTITLWSAELARSLGVPAEDATGRPLDEVLGAAARGAGAGERYRRAIGGDTTAGADLPLRRPDGSEVVVDLVSAGPGGPILIRDVTERRELQTFLAELQSRLSDLEDLGRVGLWVWDRASGELQWSPQLFDIHAIDPMTFDATLDSHVAPIREDHRERVRASLADAGSGGPPVETEYPVVVAGGDERWVYLRADPVLSVAGEVEGLTGIVQDVTETRSALREARAARNALERFAAAVAHDLKEPLASIDGFAGLLAEEAQLEDPHDDYLERISANAKRAVNLIGAILEEARTPTVGDAVALEDVLEWVRETLSERLERTSSRIEILGPLPHVSGSTVPMRQVMLNLISNAVKYRHGDRPATVTIAAVDDGDHVTVTVDDDGPGIPEEQRDRVFDDGYRSPDALDRGIEGTGIGLSTVRRILADLRGSVRIEDAPAGGARFVLTLPTAPTTAPGGPAAPQPRLADEEVAGPHDDHGISLDPRTAREQAMELNDNIVQGVTTALWMLEVDEGERAVTTLRNTLAEARRMMTDMLEAGSAPVEAGMLRRSTAAPSMTADVPTSPAEPPTSTEATYRVVIADDAESARILLRRRLEATGMVTVVGEATNGAEAIAAVSELAPDGLVLDLAMPVLDGLEAARAIRPHHPDLRIVVLSGHPAAALSPQAEQAGADAYVEKGTPFDELLVALGLRART